MSSSQHPPESPAGSTVRVWTVIASLGLALLVAFATPWNDFGFRNTPWFNHYLPVVVTLLLVVLQLLINPLLGRFRLTRPELVVVVGFLLGAAGVASSGLLRYFPAAITVPTQALAGERTGKQVLQVPAAPGQPSQTWRWAYDHRLYVGMPAAGPASINEPTNWHAVNGYLSGEGLGIPSVRHACRVVWRGPDGQVHDDLAQATPGPQTTGILRLDRQPGLSLLGLRPGQHAWVDGTRRHTVQAGETWSGLAQKYYGNKDLGGPLALHLGRPAQAMADPGTILHLPDSCQVLAVATTGPPLATWGRVLWQWAPLLAGAILAMLALAGLTARQWQEHERLPHPLAQVTLALLEPAPPDRRWPILFTHRGFQAAVVTVLLLLLWRVAAQCGFFPIEPLQSLDLRKTFAAPPWNEAFIPRFFYDLRVWFGLVGLAFFLPLDLSFSLWFFFVATNAVCIVTTATGIPIDQDAIYQTSVGGWGMLALLVLWLGRRHFLALGLAALGLRRGPELRDGRMWVWVLLAGAGSMWAFIWLHGAPPLAALTVVLMFLAVILVLARLVAEAGIPFVQLPADAGFTAIALSLTGVPVPPTALIPLTWIGSILLADTRENLTPYAVNATCLANRSGMNLRRILLGAGLSALLAVVVGGLAMLQVGHQYGAKTADPYGSSYFPEDQLDQTIELATKAATPEGQERLTVEARRRWTNYGIGASLVAGLGAGRVLVTGWPLHPIGYVVSTTYPTWQGWFSFLLGWLAKLLVLRFGGSGLYSRLKPVAIGLIVGEALAIGLTMLAHLVAAAVGHPLAKVALLPG